MKHYDMLVIGSGPSGHHAAIQAAKLGKRVAVVERAQWLGGSSVHTATVPSKALREAVLYLSGFRQRGLYGISYRVKEDITVDDLLMRCQRVIQAEIDIVRAQFHRNGVDMLIGSARFVGPHRVAIVAEDMTEPRAVAGGYLPTKTPATSSFEVEADFVVIATGSVPSRPKEVEFDEKHVLDSDGIFEIHELPRTMTVVGAGVVGVEYACMFAVLGVTVLLVDARQRILEFLDNEILDALLYHLREIHGITLRFGEEVTEVTKRPDNRVTCKLKSRKEVVSDCVLYSAGRLGNTDKLNLAAAGLSADARGRLKVNEHYQTEVPHIYAVGDVVGFPALASVSMEQGRLASCHAFEHLANSVPELFPFGLYTIPGISMVGKTEERLTAESVPYETGLARYREIARGLIVGDPTGLLKLLFHRETRKILGVHIIGRDAPELVHIGQAVMAFDGTIDFFVKNVFNYPTLAECYKVAALNGLNKIGA